VLFDRDDLQVDAPTHRLLSQLYTIRSTTVE
jgi:hypothetical protein